MHRSEHDTRNPKHSNQQSAARFAHTTSSDSLIILHLQLYEQEYHMTSSSENDQQIRQDIRRKASNQAEASVYSLNNPYLTKTQKFWVECWYQLPIAVFQITLFSLLILTFKSEWKMNEAVVASYAIGTAASLINWAAPLKPILAIGSIFLGWMGTLIDLGFAGYFVYEKQWWFAGLAVAASIGLLSIISPSMILYTVLSQRMHPKYEFAKRHFGVRFPFEDS
jgi:hypothetical protein